MGVYGVCCTFIACGGCAPYNAYADSEYDASGACRGADSEYGVYGVYGA